MQIIGLHGAAGAGKDTVADYLVSQYGFVRFGFADALYDEVSAAFGVSHEELRNRETKELPNPKLTLNKCRDREFAKIAEGIPPSSPPMYDSIDFRDYPLSPRWVLQVWGTEYRRGQDPQYWMNKADMWVEAYGRTLERVITQADYEEAVDDTLNAMNAERGPDEEFATREEAVDIVDAYGPKVGSIVLDAHPGVVITDVRFPNEYNWLKMYNGELWHIQRPGTTPVGVKGHESDKAFPIRTGDKLIINGSSIERLHTGVTLVLQGNSIINTTEE